MNPHRPWPPQQYGSRGSVGVTAQFVTSSLGPLSVTHIPSPLWTEGKEHSQHDFAVETKHSGQRPSKKRLLAFARKLAWAPKRRLCCRLASVDSFLTCQTGGVRNASGKARKNAFLFSQISSHSCRSNSRHYCFVFSLSSSFRLFHLLCIIHISSANVQVLSYIYHRYVYHVDDDHP